ncbi:unnamed protein product [Spirodela intermedia]|uniref:Uncharacterized protein n=1 Tax=Spirodela intermedia TaxID=51605 RepID=A0ABN7E9U8_SPIIN|nr:unnamed protein product [Spirodela intermedia]
MRALSFSLFSSLFLCFILLFFSPHPSILLFLLS